MKTKLLKIILSLFAIIIVGILIRNTNPHRKNEKIMCIKCKDSATLSKDKSYVWIPDHCICSCLCRGPLSKDYPKYCKKTCKDCNTTRNGEFISWKEIMKPASGSIHSKENTIKTNYNSGNYENMGKHGGDPYYYIYEE